MSKQDYTDGSNATYIYILILIMRDIIETY